MKISQRGLTLIKRHEGLRLEVYLCPAGITTVGWGHVTTQPVGTTISLHQAEVILAHDLEKFEAGVLELFPGVKLTQGQFDALVSFSLNVGLTALANSTLRKKLLRGDLAGAADEFLRWTKAGGKVLAGLVKRRGEERAMFLGQ